MKITLDPNLERALLRAVAEGTCPPTIVDPGELSKKGKAVHAALVHLFKRGAKAPIKPASIGLAAHNLTGFPQASADAYLRSFKEFQTGEEIVSILETAREKAALVEVINSAGSQLASGKLDAAALERALLASKVIVRKEGLRSIGAGMLGKFPKPPRGHDIISLPDITTAANGMAGIWIIGGEPGLGKSTLALQIAVDISARFPCLYYDLDGTGETYFVERLRQIFDSNFKRFKQKTQGLYYRDSVHSLDADIAHPSLKDPALIVIDSIQTLPTINRFNTREPHADEWLRRFKDLIKRGYTVLGISEKPRSHYGVAEMGGYKSSGEIEYSGTICAHIIADEDDDNILRWVVVKNRHGPLKGHITNLVRDDEKIFWFREDPIRSFNDRRKKKERK